jgi:hypothetical protein
MKRFLMLVLVSTTLGLATRAGAYDPLEQYEYEDLVLVETKVTAEGKWIACFLEKTDYRVFAAGVGTHVGHRGAEIMDISTDSATLMELVPINSGYWTESTFTWPVAAKPGRRGLSCKDAVGENVPKMQRANKLERLSP